MDPARFHGTACRAANRVETGLTRGFARQGPGHIANERPKRVFPLPLSRTAWSRFRAFRLDPRLQHGVPRMTLSAGHMETLPDRFRDIDDPGRKKGRRHTLPSVPALATAPVPVGMRGCREIREWVDDLGPSGTGRSRVRFRNGLTFEQGRIHALLGQNGAGKSTLARALSGVLAPRSGRLQIESQDVAIGDAAAARAAGLDIVHQRPVLPLGLSVSEALEFASARKTGGRLYSRRGIDTAWQDRPDAAGIQVSTSARLSRLPVETVQAIEFTQVLTNDARVLILDEPTASAARSHRSVL